MPSVPPVTLPMPSTSTMLVAVGSVTSAWIPCNRPVVVLFAVTHTSPVALVEMMPGSPDTILLAMTRTLPEPLASASMPSPVPRLCTVVPEAVVTVMLPSTELALMPSSAVPVMLPTVMTATVPLPPVDASMPLPPPMTLLAGVTDTLPVVAAAVMPLTKGSVPPTTAPVPVIVMLPAPGVAAKMPSRPPEPTVTVPVRSITMLEAFADENISAMMPYPVVALALPLPEIVI